MTPVPATATAAATVTPVQTLTSTVEPSATPEPTATITESPAPTTAPTEKSPPPEGFADWAEARKYGWVENADGKPEQHMVKNENGDVMFGDLVMELLEAKYEDHKFIYQVPKIDGNDYYPNLRGETVGELGSGSRFFTFTYHVKNRIELEKYLGLSNESFMLEIYLDDGQVYTINNGQEDSLWYSETVYSSEGDPVGIYGVIAAIYPKTANVVKVRQARGGGQPAAIVYEAQK